MAAVAAGGVADPVRFARGEVREFWSAVRAMDEAAARIERACAHAAGHNPARGTSRASVEAVTAGVVRMRRSLAEVIAVARAAGLPPGDGERVDTGSRRWFTAVHEAAHAIVAAHLGHHVEFAGATTDATGVTKTGDGRRDMTGADEAVIAVAGERATRALLGMAGGAMSDYARAESVLARTGRSVAWAEQIADQIIRDRRSALVALARRIYRHGRENNIGT